MTWGEFKLRVEALGVKDDDAIDWIDTGGGYGFHPDHITAHEDAEGWRIGS
jgi:hypothetical protein